MSRGRNERQAGFTLIEILLAVAVIAVLSGAGFFAVSSVQESARQGKLQSDVASLNRSVQLYQANGGTIATNATADDVLTKLKTRSNASLGLGLTKNFIDTRITPTWQSSSEAGTTQMRAVWNATEQQFVVTQSGAVGIKEFDLDESKAATAPTLETRTQSMSPTTSLDQPSWIWQSTNATVASTTNGSQPGTANRAGSTNQSRGQLQVPTFSPGTGPYTLPNFNVSVSLANPNPTGVSAIYYSLNGAASQLYTGAAISVPPNQSLSAYAMSLDIVDWLDSDSSTQTYTLVPYQLKVKWSSAPPTTMTYAAAGGAMVAGSGTVSPTATAIPDIPDVPASYLSDTYFKLWYDYGSTATAGTHSSVVIPLSLANWGSHLSLTVSASAKATTTGTAFFADSTPLSATITGLTTSLNTPIFNPPSGQKDPSTLVTLTPASGYPVGYQIYYTTDGNDPGAGSDGKPTALSKTLYTSGFSTSSTSSVTVRARVYGPSGYEQWFIPSASATATYTFVSSASPDGALVGNATVNGTFVGSLIYTNATGNLPGSINFNSGATITNGNVYFPGLPNLTFNGNENTIIQGRQFDSNGVETLPNTDTTRVVDLTGATTPVYNVTFNSGAVIQGKVYRRVTPPVMPTVSAPISPNNSNTFTLNSGSLTVDPTQKANGNINSGTATLMPGAYGSLNVGGTIILGTAGATTPSIYSFTGMNLNSNSKVIVLGPVIVTMGGSLNISSATLGNSAHPEYLQLNMFSGDLTINSGGAIYGQVVAPNNTVNLNGTFNGSVVAKSLSINGGGVAFTLPPVVSG